MKKSKSIIRYLSALLVFGIVLLGVGIYSAQVYGYKWGNKTPDPDQELTLGQFVYYQEQGGDRVYLGDFIGIYSIGTKTCTLYQATGSGSGAQLQCLDESTGYGPVGVYSENAWGILVNVAPDPDRAQTFSNAPSQIYAILPISQNGQLSSYVVAALDDMSGSAGHEWVAVPANKHPLDSPNSRVGVELVLHDQTEYPAQLHPVD